MSAETRTVVITGASGLLGRAVAQEFSIAGWKTVGTAFSRTKSTSPQLSQTTLVPLDLIDSAQIERVLDQHAPQIVIHSAAQRAPDAVAADPDAAKKLNVEATASLAAACAARNIPCIYISTDYVFSGAEGEAPYSSSSTTGPTNAYGETKLAGEHALLDATSDTCTGFVFRVPVLYGETDPRDNHSESAVNVLVDAVWKAQKGSVKMDDWSQRYPTCTEDVGRVLTQLASTLLDYQRNERARVGGGTRILAFTAEQRLTKLDMCRLLAEVLGLPMGQMVADDAPSASSSAVRRPYDCHLGTRELQALGVDVRAQDFVAWWRRYLGATRR